MNIKNNSIINEAFDLIKNLMIEKQSDFVPDIIVEADINKCNQDAIEVQKLCKELNRNSQFIQKINSKIEGYSNQIVKTELFLLSEIIHFIENQKQLTQKQWFFLAYYYDVFKNENFGDVKAIKTLNKIATSDAFVHNTKQLIANAKIKKNRGQSGNLILDSLKELNHDKYGILKQKYNEILINILGKDQFEDSLLQNDNTVVKSDNAAISYPPDQDSLEKVLQVLNSLVGLENIKNDIKELINLLEIQKKRENQGLKNIDLALHTVFLGPPGTGKTTVARLLSRIFKILGFLSVGQLYETDREGLIAGYVGQTAIKTDEVVDQSMGGVLFIDEAYALNTNSNTNDYGSEAVNTILKRMEDNRDDLAVVVAGYTEPMQLFIESNPGLRSRFNRFFQFEHFKPKELFEIYDSFCKDLDFVLTSDAIDKLKETFEMLYEKRDDSFGNARVVRNLFEKCVQNQANRIIKINNITRDVLRAITEEDIPEPNQTVEVVFFSSK